MAKCMHKTLLHEDKLSVIEAVNTSNKKKCEEIQHTTQHSFDN